MVDKAIPTGRRARPVAAGERASGPGDRHEPQLPMSLEALVATQMPGWEIDPDADAASDEAEDSRMQSEKGPSIAELRRKFLGDADAADNAPDTFAEVDRSVETVRVKPTRGGPAKVADIRNGKLSIVQG